MKVGNKDALKMHAGFPLALENGEIREVFPVIEFEMFTRKSWKSEGKLYQKIKNIFYIASLK